MQRKPLIIVGAGGYAKSVLDSLDTSLYDFKGFIDERQDKNEHLGYQVLAHSLSELSDCSAYSYFVAIGNNTKRCDWYNQIKALGCEIINVVDPTALVSEYATLGEGCFVGKLAIINAGATIGNDTVVNTTALVEHGCKVGNHVNLSTKSIINGDVVVGDGSFIGSASTSIGQVTIGSWSIIGAGAVVTRDVPDGVTAVGIPARVVKSEAHYW